MSKERFYFLEERVGLSQINPEIKPKVRRIAPAKGRSISSDNHFMTKSPPK